MTLNNIYRHSSPKHYSSRSSGSTNSPRVQEYRPNINDLKQFFDESKRHSHMKNPSASSYVDAKPSYLLQDEMLFDTAKRKEFERNKLKFDQKAGRNLSASSKHKAQEFRVPSKSFDINQRNDYDMKFNINEPQYNYDSEAPPLMSKKSSLQNQASSEKQDNTVNMAANFNLDGFKVSEDDDEDVSCRVENITFFKIILHAFITF